MKKNSSVNCKFNRAILLVDEYTLSTIVSYVDIYIYIYVDFIKIKYLMCGWVVHNYKTKI